MNDSHAGGETESRSWPRKGRIGHEGVKRASRGGPEGVQRGSRGVPEGVVSIPANVAPGKECGSAKARSFAGVNKRKFNDHIGRSKEVKVYVAGKVVIRGVESTLAVIRTGGPVIGTGGPLVAWVPHTQVLGGLQQLQQAERMVATLGGGGGQPRATADPSMMSASQLASTIRHCEASHAQLSNALKQMEAQHGVASSVAHTRVTGS
eukprot:1189860-Prorocentrum_minimum.AAC.1